MARKFLAALFATALTAAVTAPAQAEFGVGADAATRYIWRGLNLDDSFVIQPYLSYATEAGIEIGAWSSWSLTSSGANENDLYVSYSTGPVSITLSDYYFPNGGGTEFFDYSSDAKIHQLEAMVSFASGPLSVTGALIFLGWGDTTPFYAEVGYEFMSGDDVSAGLFAGFGLDPGADKENSGTFYYTSSGDPALINVGVGVSMGDYSASYILNPDTEQSYLVLMKGL